MWPAMLTEEEEERHRKIKCKILLSQSGETNIIHPLLYKAMAMIPMAALSSSIGAYISHRLASHHA
jgi:hypothetical protein